MVVIRLARGGAKKRPFYHLVVSDKRSPRDSKYIERVGYFNPTAKGGEIGLLVERERVTHWIANGAQLSDRAQVLLKQWDKNAATAA